MIHTVVPPSRQIAKQIGSSRYFTGKPCLSGNFDLRRASDAHCRCPECTVKITLRAKKCHDANKEHRAIYKAKWWRSNKNRRNKYQRERYKRDPNLKMKMFCHYSIRRVILNKGKRSQEILGYHHEDLVSHIESKFLEGMTWENYGEWHVDHIKPVKVFVEEGETDPAIINALSNLQPLWASDNMSKGCKYEH